MALESLARAPSALALHSGCFTDGLRARLAEVESHAAREVDRLVDTLADLRAENARLKTDLVAARAAAAVHEVEETERSREEGEAAVPEEKPPEPPQRAVDGSGGLPRAGPREEGGLCEEVGPHEEGEPSEAEPKAGREWSSSQGGDSRRAKRSSTSLGAFFRNVVSPSNEEGGNSVRALYSAYFASSMADFSISVAGEAAQAVTHTLDRHDFPECKFYKTHGLAQRIVRSRGFEYASMLLVLLNAVWISFDLDANGKSLLQSPVPFQITEHCFVAVFAVELALRFMAFRRKRFAWQERWFVFDFTLVLIMILEEWVAMAIMALSNKTKLSSFHLLSVLRLLRLLRLTRLWRLFFILPELQTMLSGMLAGVRAVFITCVLLLTLTYFFAIAIRVLGESTTWGEEKFSSVPRAVYTLLVETIMPNNGALLGDMGAERWYCAVLYAVFHLLATVTVMNMLIGILCDVMSQVSSDSREQHSMDVMASKLQAMLASFDESYDGLVTKTDFDNMATSEEALEILLDVGVDVRSLVEAGDFIFSRCESGCLTFEDFKEELLMFRPSHQSCLRSLRMIWKHIRDTSEDLQQRLTDLEGERARTMAAPTLAPLQSAPGGDGARASL